MKKSIYLLFALFILSMVSCNYATNTKGNTMTEDPMAKENKSLVQEKQQKINDFFGKVSLTSKKEDGRSIEEKLKNDPPKENIINTVLFDNGLNEDKFF